MKKQFFLVCLIGILVLFSGCTQNPSQQNNQNSQPQTNTVAATVCPTGLDEWASKAEFGNPATQFSNSDGIFVAVKSDANCEQRVKASLFGPAGNLVLAKEYNIPQGITGYGDYNPNKNLAAGNYTFKMEYGTQLIKTIQIAIVPAETNAPPSDNGSNEPLSEQPSQEKFNEYFTEAYLGKLQLGVQVGPPNNFPTRTTVFTIADQFCSNFQIIKAIPAGKLGTAVYDTNSKRDIQPKSNFPRELKTGGTSGCQTMDFAPGKYEYKIYVDDVLAAVLPFEVK